MSKLGGMLGSSRYEIFSKRQISDILFGFMMNALAWKRTDDIEAYLREPSLHKAFPRGLYGYFLDHGWPRVPFEYQQNNDFIERMMNELGMGWESDHFQTSAKLALLLFGRANVPEQIESMARIYLREKSAEFKRMKNEAQDIFMSRAHKEEWAAYAEGLLDLYDEMMDLDGIINGKERMRRVPFNRRFGVTLDYLRDLKMIRRGNW